MKKKIFAISDVHGYAHAMIDALNEAGFESGNENHLLVCLGDCFDRGDGNEEVLSYLEKVPNKVLIRGNHEDMLLDTLRRGLDTTDLANGSDLTISELFGEESVDAFGNITPPPEKLARVMRFIDSMLDYFETEHYVFVHGWVPIDAMTNPVSVLSDWRSAGKEEWTDARFLEWQQTYKKHLTIPGKVIVCGHRPAGLGHYFDPSRFATDHTTFFGDGVVAIDAYTYRTGFVNVFVVEDEV